MLFIASFAFESRYLTVISFEGNTLHHMQLDTAMNPIAVCESLGLELAKEAKWTFHATGLTGTLTEAPLPEWEQQLMGAVEPVERVSPNVGPLELTAALVDFAGLEAANLAGIATGAPVDATYTDRAAIGRDRRARDLLRARGIIATTKADAAEKDV